MIVVTPRYNTIHPATVRSVERIAAHVDLWDRRRGTLIWRARNAGVQSHPSWDKRQPARDDILHLDADIAFEPHDLDRLLSHGLPIVGGAYADRDTGRLCGGWLRDSGEVELVPPDAAGLVEVDWIGAGFLYTAKEVFDRIEYPWFRPYYWNLRDRAEYMGEDIGFCMQARAAGYTIYMDCDCRVIHYSSTHGGTMTRIELGRLYNALKAYRPPPIVDKDGNVVGPGTTPIKFGYARARTIKSIEPIVKSIAETVAGRAKPWTDAINEVDRSCAETKENGTPIVQGRAIAMFGYLDRPAYKLYEDRMHEHQARVETINEEHEELVAGIRDFLEEEEPDAQLHTVDIGDLPDLPPDMVEAIMPMIREPENATD